MFTSKTGAKAQKSKARKFQKSKTRTYIALDARHGGKFDAEYSLPRTTTSGKPSRKSTRQKLTKNTIENTGQYDSYISSYYIAVERELRGEWGSASPGIHNLPLSNWQHVKHKLRAVESCYRSLHIPQGPIGAVDVGCTGELTQASLVLLLMQMNTLAAIEEDSVFLDLGCGGGKPCAFFGTIFPRNGGIIGIESQKDVVTIAKHFLGKVDVNAYVCHGDIMNIPRLPRNVTHIYSFSQAMPVYVRIFIFALAVWSPRAQVLCFFAKEDMESLVNYLKASCPTDILTQSARMTNGSYKYHIIRLTEAVKGLMRNIFEDPSVTVKKLSPVVTDLSRNWYKHFQRVLNKRKR